MRPPSDLACVLTITLSMGILLASCGEPPFDPHQSRKTTAPIVTETVTGTAPACVVSHRGQADRRCDPGARNPDVTPATIHQTICVPGWSDRVRPSTSYTSELRDAEILLYYHPGKPVTDVVMDHLIPQSLGGALKNPQNIWPQPKGPDVDKNNHGNRLRVLVCSGQMTLDAAQQEILDTWTWIP